MSKFKDKYRIESARLKNWNYATPGAYFITICTKSQIKYFGEIKNNEMHLSRIGKIIFKCWHNLPNHYFNLILDEFIIMPNHLHGILIIPPYDIDNKREYKIDERIFINIQNFLRNKEYLKEKSDFKFQFMPNINFNKLLNNMNASNKNAFFNKIVQTGLRPVCTDAYLGSNIKKIPESKNDLKIHGISEFIRALKSFSSREINEMEKKKIKLWHERFHDHIIRDENELNRIRNYIKNNPKKWRKDNNYE